VLEASEVAVLKGIHKDLAAICGKQLGLDPIKGNLLGNNGAECWVIHYLLTFFSLKL
jgi:hypothetical protein